MTIRSLSLYMANLWDWGFLDICFGGTRVRVSDIDGYVERNGHFLYFEAKSPGAAVPLGQAISFDAWTRRGDRVLVLWGKPGEPELMKDWPGPQQPCTLRDVQVFVADWWKWATSTERAS